MVLRLSKQPFSFSRSLPGPVVLLQFEIHGCIPEGVAAPSPHRQEFTIMSFCDGTTCVHLPPMQSFAHTYVDNTGPATPGMGCYSGGGAHNGLLPFLGEVDVGRAGYVNEKMMHALSKSTGAPFKGVLQGHFKCEQAGVSCTSFGSPLLHHPTTPILLSLL